MRLRLVHGSGPLPVRGWAAWSLVLVLAGGCATHGVKQAKDTSARPVEASSQGEAVAGQNHGPRCDVAGPHAVSRATFERYWKAGPGHLLAQLEIRRYPRRGEGPFRGWLVAEVRDPCLALALKPGDVILALNGRVVERPMDLWGIWRSLKDSSRVTMLRLRSGRVQVVQLDVVD